MIGLVRSTEDAMRYINIAIVIALAAAMLIFAFQNLQVVTVSFFGFQLSAPLAVQAILIYLLGMITGGGAWAMVRWAFEGMKQAT
jgi:lipopolysaccharide assembly protein A